MSYKRTSPAPVIEGGTGRATLTNHGVVVGAGTSAVTSLGVASNGELIIGSTGSDPVIASLTAGTNITITPGAGTLSIGQTTAGISGPGTTTDRAIATWNGTGGTALFNNAAIKVASGGQMTNTSQPAFTAYLATPTANNKVGDGSTFYTILFDTKVFDQGTNYSTSTGMFTAPVTGRYMFSVQCTTEAVVNANQRYFQGQLVTTARTYYTFPSIFNALNPNGFMTANTTVFTDMTANDTALFRIYGSYTGNTNSIGVYGSASPYFTYFSGFLVC